MEVIAKCRRPNGSQLKVVIVVRKKVRPVKMLRELSQQCYIAEPGVGSEPPKQLQRRWEEFGTRAQLEMQPEVRAGAGAQNCRRNVLELCQDLETISPCTPVICLVSARPSRTFGGG